MSYFPPTEIATPLARNDKGGNDEGGKRGCRAFGSQ